MTLFLKSGTVLRLRSGRVKPSRAETREQTRPDETREDQRRPFGKRGQSRPNDMDRLRLWSILLPRLDNRSREKWRVKKKRKKKGTRERISRLWLANSSKRPAISAFTRDWYQTRCYRRNLKRGISDMPASLGRREPCSVLSTFFRERPPLVFPRVHARPRLRQIPKV